MKVRATFNYKISTDRSTRSWILKGPRVPDHSRMGTSDDARASEAFRRPRLEGRGDNQSSVQWEGRSFRCALPY